MIGTYKNSQKRKLTDKDGQVVTADVHLEIDIDAIMSRLSYRAMLSKTGKSSFMCGLVKLRATNIQKAPAVALAS